MELSLWVLVYIKPVVISGIAVIYTISSCQNLLELGLGTIKQAFGPTLIENH